jgi:ribonucleoside-diphosphate reductase alpha chain
VRFLDDVIDVNNYPIPEIEHMARGNRKIGLGVMGFAEMLIRLGISYDSNQAIAVAGRVMEFINNEALVASQQLAEERGVFPFWKESIHASRGLRLHNATRTAIAPTGTIGIIAGTSASIEPLFALAYRRSHGLGAETLYEINPLLVEFAEHRGLDVHRMVEKVRETGSLAAIPGAPEDLRRLFVTALEIPAERHLQIQAFCVRHP